MKGLQRLKTELRCGRFIDKISLLEIFLFQTISIFSISIGFWTWHLFLFRHKTCYQGHKNIIYNKFIEVQICGLHFKWIYKQNPFYSAQELLHIESIIEQNHVNKLRFG